MNVANPIPERLLYTKKEACALLGGIHVNTMDTIIRRGEIRFKRIGNRQMFPKAELEKFARRGLQGFDASRVQPHEAS